ncbi:MAG: response regulator [Deltaproteobacteria bacterium]|nr:response regulator [Deltaproteobacteria bacterium]
MAKILIIEDNNKLALFIQQFLTKKGHQSAIALDGVKGLKSFATEIFDLLLVDIKLPHMDGEALTAKVRASEKGKDIPIIMMSGFVKMPAEIERLKKTLHVSDFLNKPFSFDKLRSSIDEALGKNTATGAEESKEESPSDQTLKGKLEEQPFENLLSHIFRKKLTGTLLVGKNKKKKRFYILRGIPAEVNVLAREDNFGNYLLKKGLISMVELRAYEDLSKNPAHDPREIFINMGCLSPEAFAKENRDYLIENIAGCFSWESGLFAFEAKPAFIPRVYSFSADLPFIFFKAFKGSLSPAKTEAFLGRKGKFYIRKGEDFFNYQNHLSTSTTVGTIFDLLDGTKTASDIINSTDLDDKTVLATLMTLDLLRIVSYSPMPEKVDLSPPFPIREKEEVTRAEEEMEEISLTEEFEDLGEELSLLSDELEGLESIQQPEEAAPAGAGASDLEAELTATWERIKDKNYYEIFGLTTQTYSFNSLKKAYFDLTGKFSPDKFFASSGEIMTLDQELLSKVAEAYETLSNVVSKENYDEYLDSQDAVSMGAGGEDDKMKIQVQFQSGKIFLEEGQYDSAEKAFTNLVSMAPDKPEYLAFLALSIYNNPSKRGSKATINKAKELINKSLQLGKISIAYALKGAILLDEGNLTLAEAEFNKALKINPSNKTALKKIEEIKERREQEKGGLFKRMFK